jgi:hypothetical protein
VLILLAALLLLGAGMSHELHDDAGALRRIVCALTHVSKFFCFMGGGNTAFEVECLVSSNYKLQSMVEVVGYSKGVCA